MFKVIKGHTQSVNAVDITPDGKFIVSASSDMTLRLWSIKKGETLRVFEGHSGEVNAIAVTPVGKSLVSGSRDNTLKLWDLKTGDCIATLDGHSDDVNAVAITPDGQFIISGSSDCELRLWDLKTAKCLRVFKRHPACLDMDDLNKLIRASNSEFSYHDFLVNLSFANTYDENNFVFFGHADRVNTVALAPDGRFAISGSEDNTLRLWDLKTGKCLWIFGGHDGGAKFGVKTAAVTPNGRFAISGSETLRLWRLSSKKFRRMLWGILSEKPIRTFKGYEGGINAITVTPDGRYIVVTGKTGNSLQLYRLKTGECLQNLEGHSDQVNAIAVTPDGQFAVSGSEDGTIRLWDLG